MSEVWQCGCGAQEWLLSANGAAICIGCRCESTIIEVRRRTDGAKPICLACQQVRMSHCSDPLNCGNVIWNGATQ